MSALHEQFEKSSRALKKDIEVQSKSPAAATAMANTPLSMVNAMHSINKSTTVSPFYQMLPFNTSADLSMIKGRLSEHKTSDRQTE